MKRAAETNINDRPYWDGIYSQEAAVGRARVDDVRLETLAKWVDRRTGELQRAVRVLDVGCGLGDVGKFFHARGTDPRAYGWPEGPSRTRVEYLGMDISAAAVAACKARYGAFLVGSADKIPCKDEQVDIVWCGETLEHVDDPDAVIRELCRVCEEQGFIVISTPYRRRNTSTEHVWEFEPADVCRWAEMVGELVYLDCCLLPSWLTMFAVFRRAKNTACS